MFPSELITNRLRVRPFRPVRIVTSAGQHFDIHHPDLVIVGQWDLTIGTGSTNDPWQCHVSTRVAIMHVPTLEDLPSTVAAEGDGEQ